jgi:hypothetical protein
MKHFILLLLVSALGYGQKLTADEQKILHLEVERKIKKLKSSNIAVDSIVINKRIPQLEYNFDKLKSSTVLSNELSPAEAEQIFGTNSSNKFILKKNSFNEWEQEYFKDFNTFFFDEQKHVYGYTPASSNKKGIGHVIIFDFSIPLIRNDDKYAVIQVGDSDGGTLEFYRRIEKGWEHYKTFSIYIN